MISIDDARMFYVDAEPVHDFHHVIRVLKMAEHLAQLEGADLAIVRQATLLHDIERLDDDNAHTEFALNVDEENDHAVLAARHARYLLRDEDADFVDAVAHAIEAHRYRNAIEPRTIEAKVLFDADKLDAIGAIGIARAFAYAGTFNMPLWGEVSADYVPGESDEAHTPLHEFVVKLQHIKDRMYTNSGRKMALVRHQYMVAFFEQMRDEVNGKQ